MIAADAAAVAKHTHKRAIIEGLSAYERRKVHTAVSKTAKSKLSAMEKVTVT